MEQPDIEKHLKALVGGLFLELAAAKAVIEVQEQALTGLPRADRGGNDDRGSENRTASQG